MMDILYHRLAQINYIPIRRKWTSRRKNTLCLLRLKHSVISFWWLFMIVHRNSVIMQQIRHTYFLGSVCWSYSQSPFDVFWFVWNDLTLLPTVSFIFSCLNVSCPCLMNFLAILIIYSDIVSLVCLNVDLLAQMFSMLDWTMNVWFLV